MAYEGLMSKMVSITFKVLMFTIIIFAIFDITLLLTETFIVRAQIRDVTTFTNEIITEHNTVPPLFHSMLEARLLDISDRFKSVSSIESNLTTAVSFRRGGNLETVPAMAQYPPTDYGDLVHFVVVARMEPSNIIVGNVGGGGPLGYDMVFEFHIPALRHVR